MSLMSEVRQAISDSHNAIEQTAFSVAMMDGTLSPKNYACGLAQLMHIHQALEVCIASRTEVNGYFNEEMIRTPAIQRDLVALGFTLTSFPILAGTKAIVQSITTWGIESPFALLGCLYILEGSRMGSLVIAKPLAKTLGLEPGQTGGVEYHVEGAASTPLRVRNLKEKIDNGVLEVGSQNALKLGAVLFMNMLNALYASLPAKDVAPVAPAPMGKCPFSHSVGQTQLRSA